MIHQAEASPLKNASLSPKAPPSETYGSIHCDIALGKLVSNIEIDSSYFMNLMTAEGLTTAQTSEASIYVSVDSVTYRDKESADEIGIGGHYDPPTKTAQINLGTVRTIMDFIRKTDTAEEAEQHDKEWYDEAGSHLASEHAVHEVSHHITKTLGFDRLDEHWEYYEDIVPQRLGHKLLRKLLNATGRPDFIKLARLVRVKEITAGISQATFDHYLASPWEVRVREIEEREAEKFEASGDYPIQIEWR